MGILDWLFRRKKKEEVLTSFTITYKPPWTPTDYDEALEEWYVNITITRRYPHIWDGKLWYPLGDTKKEITE